MSNLISYHQTNNDLNLNPSDGTSYAQIDPFRNLSSPNLNISFPTSAQIKLSPRKVNFQPNTLGNTAHVYTTPNYSDIIALANYFADWSCAYEIQEGPIHTMTVQIPWDTITSEDFWISDFASEQWEIVPNMDQKSLIFNGLLANPFALPSSIAGNYVILPDVLKAGVQKAFENKYAFFSMPSGSSIPSSSFIPYAQKTLNYMRFGVEGVPSYTQTLKRTAVIDERNSNNAFQKAIDLERASFSQNNGTINYIMSTPDLITEYSVPQDTVAKFMLPSYSKAITVQTYDSAQYITWAGWLVKPPSFQFITRNKIQLTQEFIWNEWLDGLYHISSNIADFPLVVSTATNPQGQSN